jgi:hypothetical protein
MIKTELKFNIYHAFTGGWIYILMYSDIYFWAGLPPGEGNPPLLLSKGTQPGGGQLEQTHWVSLGLDLTDHAAAWRHETLKIE